jgi:hypothetical protein
MAGLAACAAALRKVEASRLRDGQMVEVDGANGVVRFVASGT